MSTSWDESAPRVLILHAYSSKNRGDGLLVELAKEAATRSLGPSHFKLIASDATSFQSGEAVQWASPVVSIKNLRRRRLSMAATFFTGPTREVRDLVREADLILAVGGGYLRGGHLAESIKSLGAHFGQLRLAAKFGSKSIYLPQSIGPFRGVYKLMMRRMLSRMATVYVRDDRSKADFPGVTSIVRMPDMAVLELARMDTSAAVAKGIPSVVFVARDLKRPRSFYSFLDQVREAWDVTWAVQSRGSGNDDYPLTKRLSNGEPPDMTSVLADPQPKIVVSTRMHAALSSLIAGHPAVHLSYERKGWGAFEDLGLSRYVINARDSTLIHVRELVDEINSDPGAYWSRFESHRADLSQQLASLHARISEVYETERGLSRLRRKTRS